MTKHRSIDPVYAPFIVNEEYTHWTLLIHEDQRYAYRCYAWLVRPGEMQDLADLSFFEREELSDVMRDWKEALARIRKPDLINWCWLGNGVELHGGHGHMHFIPRYRDDGRWGKNYAPYEPLRLTDLELLRRRDALQQLILGG